MSLLSASASDAGAEDESARALDLPSPVLCLTGSMDWLGVQLGRTEVRPSLRRMTDGVLAAYRGESVS